VDNFDTYKKVDTEFLCNGHGGRVLDGSFSSDGNRLVSVSSENTLIMWDLANRSFLDSSVPKICTHNLTETYRVVEWCRWVDVAKNIAVVCLIGEYNLDYFKVGPNIFEKVDSVEDPHLGSRCD
jgi:WD40 repeat protein